LAAETPLRAALPILVEIAVDESKKWWLPVVILLPTPPFLGEDLVIMLLISHFSSFAYTCLNFLLTSSSFLN